MHACMWGSFTDSSRVLHEIHQTLYPLIYYSLWGQTGSTFKPKNLQPSKEPQAWKKVQGM
jgi:hypothetical protein